MRLASPASAFCSAWRTLTYPLTGNAVVAPHQQAINRLCAPDHHTSGAAHSPLPRQIPELSLLPSKCRTSEGPPGSKAFPAVCGDQPWPNQACILGRPRTQVRGRKGEPEAHTGNAPRYLSRTTAGRVHAAACSWQSLLRYPLSRVRHWALGVSTCRGGPRCAAFEPV